MLQEERRQRIRSMLATFGGISVDRLKDEFDVARETIRRDLLDMERLGELRRVHGGAMPVEETREAPYTVRSTVRMREKRMIAQAAARLVEPGQTLFLDAGSTTTLLAESLSTLSGLTVITNSVDVAARIGGAGEGEKRQNRIVLIGGDFTVEPPSTSGARAINEIRRYRADIALLSPVGLDGEAGATSYDPNEAEVARAMLAGARRKVLLADHSKIGLVSRISYASADEIDTIVVDAKAQGEEALARLVRDPARLVLAH